MSLTVAIALAMSLEVPDAKGHLNYRKMPADMASAVVYRCSQTKSPAHCASLVATLGFRESGYDFNARHDGNKGCGAFGVLCTYPHATWQEQVDTAWTLLVKSAATCEVPLALYVSGSCGAGHWIAKEYMRIARAIAAKYVDQVEHATESR